MNNLEKFASDLSSWYWWVSVVLVGLVINLASSYLKPTLDRFYDRWSTTRRSARIEANESYQLDVRVLVSDPRLLVCRGFDEIRFRVFTVVFFLFSFAIGFGAIYIKKSSTTLEPFTSILSITFLVFSLLAMAMAMWAHKHATYLAQTMRGVNDLVIHELYPSTPKQSPVSGA